MRRRRKQQQEKLTDISTEIMTIQPTGNDSMVHIVDIADDFSHTMEPILRMYSAAMSATIARLEIIEDEFKYRGLRKPIHHIDSRLKSAKSILGKLEKKNLDLTLSAACNNIYDIAGIRVVCPYIKDVYLIRDRLIAQDDLHIMEMKDYIEAPKPNGYRSLHMIIRIPVYFMNKKQLVPVELQIRTLAMDLWASLEHDIKYKSLYSNSNLHNIGSTSTNSEMNISNSDAFSDANTDIDTDNRETINPDTGTDINSDGLFDMNADFDMDAELKECSRLIYEAEAKMERMNQFLEG